MNPLAHTLMAVAWACILAPGCDRTPSPARPALVPPDLIGWGPGPEKVNDPLPGIDYAQVYHLGETLALWSDVPSLGGGNIRSSNGQGVECHLELTAKDGRRVEFQCESTDGETERATINGVPYELAGGNVFLVSMADAPLQVKQLKRDLTEWRFEKDRLRELGREDADIAAFFNDVKNKKPVEQNQ